MGRYDGARAIAQPAGPKCSVVVTDGVQSLVGVSKTRRDLQSVVIEVEMTEIASKLSDRNQKSQTRRWSIGVETRLLRPCKYVERANMCTALHTT